MIELLQTVDGLAPGTYSHLGPDEECRLVCSGLARVAAGPVPVLSATQVRNFNFGRLTWANGRFEQFERRPRVPRDTSGIAHTGPGRLEAIICSVAAGTITIYDNTAASGRVVVETFPLLVGRFSMDLDGEPLTIGCYVALSNAAARVQVVVG